MKWIGQNIYDYISRFRSDVYLEDISTGTIASGGNLGLDSNNKIVKATEASGDLTSIVAGTGLSGTSLTGPIPTLNVDAAQTGITSLGTLNSLAVTSASDLGSAAMTLTNADIDQIALDINANNTTANVIDINAVEASSGNVIFIDSADAVNEINIDKDYSRTVSHTGQVIKIASDKTATTADSQTYSQTGLISSVSDGGRNHANATNIVVNQDLTSNMGYADGTTTLYGIKNTLTGAADTAAGIYSNVGNDLGPDIHMVDSADTTNYCRIATTANGALNITTHDQSGSDANVGFAVDGTFSVASTGIDIATDGTITNAAWQGTAIATDQQKHLANFEFEGFSVGDGTNYMIPEIHSDTKAPFEHQTSTGSDGLTATSVIRLLRTSGHVMPYAGTLKLWKGWATSSGNGQTVDVGLYKFTFVNNDTDDVSPVALKNTSFTSVSNTRAFSFSETSFSVAFAAGDILISAIRNGTNNKKCEFTSTLVVEWD